MHYNGRALGGNHAHSHRHGPRQVTFRKDLLQHVGIAPGEKVEVDTLPDGRVTLKAAGPKGTIDAFIGALAGKTKKVATLEEIQKATEAGWAGLE